MSLRLIAGEKGGLALVSPKGTATRPTLGRVRGSLFNILQDRLAGARVLDLFAGAGTLGLEALSRGAAHATFVESARPAIASLRANIEKTGWQERCRTVERDAFAWLKQSDGAGSFDLILLDPPYHGDLAGRTLAMLGERSAIWLAPGGTVAAQVGRRDAMAASYGGLVQSERREYSETSIAFYGLPE